MTENHSEKVVTNSLGHKIGPLPVWAWAGIAVGSGLVVYYVFLRANGGDSSTAHTLLAGTPLPSGAGGGSGSGNADGSVPPATVTPEVTKLGNQEWLQDATGKVASALGMDTAVVSFYLREYLGGQMPVGSTRATTAFQRVIASAIQQSGQPASAPPYANPNVNPFTSNTTWLENALGFLPNGIAGSVRQELLNLFNGDTSELSQAAADALDNARNVIGYEPNLRSFKIKPAASAAPAPPSPPPKDASPGPGPAPSPNPVLSAAFKAYSTIISGPQVALRYSDIALGGPNSLIPALSVVVTGRPDSGGQRSVTAYVLDQNQQSTGTSFSGRMDQFGNVGLKVLGNELWRVNAPQLLQAPTGYG